MSVCMSWNTPIKHYTPPTILLPLNDQKVGKFLASSKIFRIEFSFHANCKDFSNKFLNHQYFPNISGACPQEFPGACPQEFQISGTSFYQKLLLVGVIRYCRIYINAAVDSKS